jgi:putative tricarboxylic transport membrane protein
LFADRVILVCTAVLAALYFWGTSLIPSLQIGDPLGPKAFPYLVGIGLVISALWLLVEILQGRRSAPAAPPTAAESAANRHTALLIGGVVAWTAFYFAVFEPLGFLVATPPFLLGLMAWFNRGRWLANLLTAVLFTLGVYLLFSKVLGVALAQGVLPF